MKYYEAFPRTAGLVSCSGSVQAPAAAHFHALPRHGSRLSPGGHQLEQGAPAMTRPQQQTANAPGAQWKNPKSLNNRTDASTSGVTAPLLHDSVSKGWRKLDSNLDGSDPRAIYVTGVPEKSPWFLIGATLPRSGEKFLLGLLLLANLTSQGTKLLPKP